LNVIREAQVQKKTQKSNDPGILDSVVKPKGDFLEKSEPKEEKLTIYDSLM